MFKKTFPAVERYDDMISTYEKKKAGVNEKNQIFSVWRMTS